MLDVLETRVYNFILSRGDLPTPLSLLKRTTHTYRGAELKDKGKETQLEKERADDTIEFIPSTKRGDRGQTSLLTGERVSKSSLRIEVCGNLDESNAALGLARAFAKNELVRNIILTIQRELVLVGAELSSTVARRPAKCIELEHIVQIEKWIEDLQKDTPLARHFVDPGANPVSAALDLARAVIRRTERSMVTLQERGQLERAEVLKYVNRLGCLLYTLARHAEKSP